MRKLKLTAKMNKEMAGSFSSELGISEEQIPRLIDEIARHPKFQEEFVGKVLEHLRFIDTITDKLARDENVRSRIVNVMS